MTGGSSRVSLDHEAVREVEVDMAALFRRWPWGILPSAMVQRLREKRIVDSRELGVCVEVGGAYGRDARKLASHFGKVIILDEEDRTADCREFLQTFDRRADLTVTFVKGDIRDPQWDAGALRRESADVVCSYSVLHLLLCGPDAKTTYSLAEAEQNLTAALTNSFAMLKPGGHVLHLFVAGWRPRGPTAGNRPARSITDLDSAIAQEANLLERVLKAPLDGAVREIKQSLLRVAEYHLPLPFGRMSAIGTYGEQCEPRYHTHWMWELHGKKAEAA